MKMTTFQIIVLALFGFFVLAGVAAFAIFGSSARNNSAGAVTIWGTIPGATMDTLLASLRQSDKRFLNVVYVYKEPSTYTQALVNAMASGHSPDIFLVTQGTVSSFADKIAPIPYRTTPQASYLSTFIDEGQLFLSPQGALALPFTIDPLVMYWNKDLFATAGVAQPPLYWNEFLSLAPKITSIDASSNVARSAVALGEWRNITYAKDIRSTLSTQAGDPIVTREQSGIPQAVLVQSSNQASSALLFYTEFANPSKTTYSWNRSLPQSRDAFAAGNVAVYFGLASDYAGLLTTNPNLSFGVAPLPQIKGNTSRLTFGDMTGLAISRGAPNPNGAMIIAQALTSAASQQALVSATGLPSVRRDVSVDTSSNASSFVFAQSALIAHGWLDPDTNSTDSIFQTMIESVLSGQQDPAAAVGEASQELSHLINSQQQQ